MLLRPNSFALPFGLTGRVFIAGFLGAALLAGCDESAAPSVAAPVKAPAESAVSDAAMKAFAETHIPGLQALIDDLTGHIADRRLRLERVAKVLRDVKRDPAKDEEHRKWSAVLAYLEWELSIAESARVDAFIAWSKYLADPAAGAEAGASAEMAALRKEFERFATIAQAKRLEVGEVAAGKRPAPPLPQAAAPVVATAPGTSGATSPSRTDGVIQSHTQTTVHTTPPTGGSASAAPSAGSSQQPGKSAGHVRFFSPQQVEAWKQKALDDYNAERKRQEDNDRKLR